MKKVLILIVTLLWVIDLQAVRLCQSCAYISNITTWRAISESNGSSTPTGSGTGTTIWSWIPTYPSGTVNGQSGCFSSDSSATGSGNYCWCRMTNVNGDVGCAGNWVFIFNYGDNCTNGCAFLCGFCARTGWYNLCSRSALLALSNSVSAVTCPTSGTCSTNSNYKTVADNASCGTGYEETTGPTLTVSGSYSNANGTFTYTNCAAN